jgi:hypothetical protein
MSKIALEGNASGTGTFTIAGPNTNTNYTITLPQETGTLVTTGVTTGLNGSAISTGVVAASVGGTGITSAGTTGNVLTSNGTAWVSQAAAAGGGDYIMQVFTSPGTYTKPAGLKAIKVTVIGGGGGAGPTAGNGGTSSFGSPAFLSATGGVAAPGGVGGGAGGAGSGGQLNASGGNGFAPNQLIGCVQFSGGNGGASAFGFGQSAAANVAGGAVAIKQHKAALRLLRQQGEGVGLVLLLLLFTRPLLLDQPDAVAGGFGGAVREDSGFLFLHRLFCQNYGKDKRGKNIF